MSERAKVDELLAEVQAISTARLKALKSAARNANLAVVDAGRLDALEALLVAVVGACAESTMTGDGFLISRYRWREMHRVAGLIAKVQGPAGCLAGPDPEPP